MPLYLYDYYFKGQNQLLSTKYNVQAWHIIKMIIWSTQVIRYSRTIKYLIKIFFYETVMLPKKLRFFPHVNLLCIIRERELPPIRLSQQTALHTHNFFFEYEMKRIWILVLTSIHISSYFAWGRSVKFSGTWKSKAHTKF